MNHFVVIAAPFQHASGITLPLLTCEKPVTDPFLSRFKQRTCKQPLLLGSFDNPPVALDHHKSGSLRHRQRPTSRHHQTRDMASTSTQQTFEPGNRGFSSTGKILILHSPNSNALRSKYSRHYISFPVLYSFMFNIISTPVPCSPRSWPPGTRLSGGRSHYHLWFRGRVWCPSNFSFRNATRFHPVGANSWGKPGFWHPSRRRAQKLVCSPRTPPTWGYSVHVRGYDRLHWRSRTSSWWGWNFGPLHGIGEIPAGGGFSPHNPQVPGHPTSTRPRCCTQEHRDELDRRISVIDYVVTKQFLSNLHEAFSIKETHACPPRGNINWFKIQEYSITLLNIQQMLVIIFFTSSSSF